MGHQHFQPSNLEVTGFDVGNATTNVIPAVSQARFNIRYNDLWTRDTISNWVEETLETARNGCDMSLMLIHSGESFLTQTGPLTDMIAQAIQDVTGRQADLSTTGGTSDASCALSANIAAWLNLVWSDKPCIRLMSMCTHLILKP